jgi:DNA-binding protein H-NS
MAPRSVFPLPAVAFEVAVIGATTTPHSKRSCPLRHTPQLAPARLDRAARSVLWGMNMKSDDLELMSLDELWALRMEINAALTRRISAEKRQLEQRLRQLGSGAFEGNVRRERRPYPRVLPKYRNPDKPSETWAGRGKRPRWLTAKLRSGKKLDDFRIQPSSSRKRRGGNVNKQTAAIETIMVP